MLDIQEKEFEKVHLSLCNQKKCSCIKYILDILYFELNIFGMSPNAKQCYVHIF